MATSSGRKRVATKSPTEKERATKRRKDSSDDSGIFSSSVYDVSARSILGMSKLR